MVIVDGKIHGYSNDSERKQLAFPIAITRSELEQIPLLNRHPSLGPPMMGLKPGQFFRQRQDWGTNRPLDCRQSQEKWGIYEVVMDIPNNNLDTVLHEAIIKG